VEAYLRHCGYEDIVYEPDGKVPPDFLVNRRIAVEVRRLNQNFKHEGRIEGLEQVSIRLQMGMRNLLASLGPSKTGESWYVFYSFSRPLDWNSLRRAVRDVLNAFIAGAGSHRADRIECKVAEGVFSLDLQRAGTNHNNFFVDGGYSDAQSGG